MKTLETGQDKIKKICSILRQETLEPAKDEAQRLIAEAELRAQHLIEEANKRAEKIVHDAREAVEREKHVFHSTLDQAVRQSLESLKQLIEQRLFNEELSVLIERQAADPKIIAKLIESLVHAIEKEGLVADLSALVPKAVSMKEVNLLLTTAVLEKLRNQSVEVGNFTGGAQLKYHQKKMTIDMSDAALKELLASNLRKDFRQLIFAK